MMARTHILTALTIGGVLVVAAGCTISSKPTVRSQTTMISPTSNPYGGMYRSDIADPRSAAHATMSLQRILSDRFPGAQLSECRDVVQFSTGKVGGNFAYGAHCTIEVEEKRTYAALCADEMVGYFAILESGLGPSDPDEMAAWTYANCGQGG